MNTIQFINAQQKTNLLQKKSICKKNITGINCNIKNNNNSVYDLKNIGAVSFGNIKTLRDPMTKSEFVNFFNNSLKDNHNNLGLVLAGAKPMSLETADKNSIANLIRFKKLINNNQKLTALICNNNCIDQNNRQMFIINNKTLKKTIDNNLEFFTARLKAISHHGANGTEEIFKVLTSKESPLLNRTNHDIIGVCLGISKENSMLLNLRHKVNESMNLIDDKNNPKIAALLEKMDNQLRPDEAGIKRGDFDKKLAYPKFFNSLSTKKYLNAQHITWQNNTQNRNLKAKIKEGMKTVQAELNTPEKIFDYIKNID